VNKSDRFADDRMREIRELLAGKKSSPAVYLGDSASDPRYAKRAVDLVSAAKTNFLPLNLSLLSPQRSRILLRIVRSCAGFGSSHPG